MTRLLVAASIATSIVALGVWTLTSATQTACAQAAPRATTPAATTAPATAPSPEQAKALAFIEHPIHFAAVCFQGEQFPACDFDDPAAVRALIGPYTLKVAYYDAQGHAVKTAAAPGRYGAVIEIAHEGTTSRRFVTLCRAGGDAPGPSTQPASLLAEGIDPEILQARASELPQPRAAKFSLYRPWESVDALLTAGLYDLTALKRAGQPLPSDSLLDLDRQWWVTFKRHYYGYDKTYTREFVCPRPIEGLPARTLRDGTPADAGLAADTLARIDAECEAWVKDSGEGCSFCVVRHGVVVLNRAYGSRTRRAVKGQPFKSDTAGELMSTTKFLSGIMVAEFADQGLLGIDDPVDQYVSPLRGVKVTRQATIRDLYLHLAGFQDHWGDSLNDLEERIADIYPALQIGEKQHYQGTGHALGGKIMEMISGESMPRLFQKHLFEPLGCSHMHSDFTSYGAMGTSMELARIGQMMLNGGAYGNLRFTTPQTIARLQPIPGHDRFDPDKTIRWGVGIKMFDSDGFSDQAYGGSGACGSFLKIDPTYDLVLAMVRDNEGNHYLQHRGSLVRVVLGCIMVPRP